MWRASTGRIAGGGGYLAWMCQHIFCPSLPPPQTWHLETPHCRANCGKNNSGENEDVSNRLRKLPVICSISANKEVLGRNTRPACCVYLGVGDSDVIGCLVEHVIPPVKRKLFSRVVSDLKTKAFISISRQCSLPCRVCHFDREKGRVLSATATTEMTTMTWLRQTAPPPEAARPNRVKLQQFYFTVQENHSLAANTRHFDYQAFHPDWDIQFSVPTTTIFAANSLRRLISFYSTLLFLKLDKQTTNIWRENKILQDLLLQCHSSLSLWSLLLFRPLLCQVPDLQQGDEFVFSSAATGPKLTTEHETCIQLECFGTKFRWSQEVHSQILNTNETNSDTNLGSSANLFFFLCFHKSIFAGVMVLSYSLGWGPLSI